MNPLAPFTAKDPLTLTQGFGVIPPASLATPRPVVTSTPAQGKITDIKAQHDDLVAGISNQQAVVAQQKATADAKKSADAAAKAQQDALAAKTAIDQTKVPKPGDKDFVPPVVTPTGGKLPGSDVANAGKEGFDVFGNPVPKEATATSTTGTTTPTQSADEVALRQRNEDMLAAAQEFKTTIQSIQSGSIPLDAGQQAQISGLQNQFQQLIEQQQKINSQAGGVAQIRGFQSGAGEYDPTFQVKTIGSIAAAGAAKVADLQIKMASAVAALTQSFKDNNISKVKMAYDVLTEAQDKYKTELQKTITNTQKAIKDAADAVEKENKRIFDEVTKPIQDIAKAAAETGAKPEVIAAINSAKTVNDAIAAAGDALMKAPTITGIVGEYTFYKNQEEAAGRVPMTFNEYQNVDANRKKSIAAASVANAQGLTPSQTSTFLRISDKFQADEVIKNAQKGSTAINIADQVLLNPGNSGNQLKILYTLVKALDPDSAVREGEIGLAQKTQSYLSTFGTTLDRISEGKIISSNAAKQLAQATKDLAEIWYAAGRQREKQYVSQAKTANVGDAFKGYLGDAQLVYQEKAPENIGKQDTKDKVQQAMNLGGTPEQIIEEMQKSPLYSNDIKSALSFGYTPEEIVAEYLK